MIAKARAMVYWLVPGGPERELFREFIRILSEQLDAPRFEPHLTICATLEDARSTRQTLAQISSKPIRLRVLGTQCSDDYTKTLFIRFKVSRELDGLSASVRRTTRMPPGNLRDPHLSLLYKRMPLPATKELASTIKLPFDEVLFDSIRVVRCALPTTSRVDVEAWEPIGARSFSGRSS
jgi:hypothetical protein